MTHRVVASVAKSRIVCISYSITKLQYSLTAKKIAVNSWDLSDSPANNYKKFRDWANITTNNYITVCKRNTCQETSEALYTFWGHVIWDIAYQGKRMSVNISLQLHEFWNPYPASKYHLRHNKAPLLLRDYNDSWRKIVTL